MATMYEAVGHGIEDMPLEHEYETNSVKDVLGKIAVKSTISNRTMTVSPLTINPEYEFAKWIDMAVEREYELDQLVKKFLCVKSYKTVGDTEAAAKPVAWVQEAVVVPGAWASGNQDLTAEGVLNFIGDRTFGTVDFSATDEKFTAETAEPTSDEIFFKDGDAKRSDFVIYFVYETA